MASPLILYPDRTVLLPPCYCATVDYYAVLSAYKYAVIDFNRRYDKRAKYTHRCTIADTRGELMLTVPVQKHDAPNKSETWATTLISPHGDWWHIHATALESAYGRTPFFEFYKDEFLPLIDSKAVGMSVSDFDRLLDAKIRRILGLETEISDMDNIKTGIVDDYLHNNLPELPVIEYYQVRNSTHGFIPHLSILDLIFNLGPEAPLVLKAMHPKA